MKVRLFLFFIFCGTIQYSFAQLNLISGYTGAYYQVDEYNSVIENRKMSLDTFRRSFSEMNFLNGASIGFNYRMDGVSIEALWTERIKIDQEQTIDLITGDANGKVGLTNRHRSISLGINVHIAELILGTSVNADLFRQNINFPQSDPSRILNEQFWSSRIHLGWFKELNYTSAISLQPYIYIPWSDINLAAMDRQLNESRTSNLPQNMMHFGISLFLYNGPQK